MNLNVLIFEKGPIGLVESIGPELNLIAFYP